MLRLRWESDSRFCHCCSVGQRTYFSRALTANGGPCSPAWRARAPWCHMGVSTLPVTEQGVVSADSAPGGTRTPARLFRRLRLYHARPALMQVIVWRWSLE